MSVVVGLFYSGRTWQRPARLAPELHADGWSSHGGTTAGADLSVLKQEAGERGGFAEEEEQQRDPPG